MNKLLTVFIFCICSTGFSLNLSTDFGYTKYYYIENSLNNKIDTYSIDSGYGGIKISQEIGFVTPFALFGFQGPFDIRVSDALGENPTNLLFVYNTFYYGLKTSLGVYKKVTRGNLVFAPGVFLIHDYFLIKRTGYSNYKTDFVFSTLGAGGLLNIRYKINNRLSLGLEGGGSYNFIALTPLLGDYIRSYGYFIKGSFSIFL